MPRRFRSFHQRQPATRRIVLACGCIGLSFLAIVGFGVLLGPYVAGNALPNHQASAAPTKIQPKLVGSFGKLPLSFEANQGQTGGRVRFLARGGGYTIFLTEDEAVLTLESPSQKAKSQRVKVEEPGDEIRNLKLETGNSKLATRHSSLAAAALAGQRTKDHGPRTMDSVLRMKLVGANASAAVTGADELPGKSNYFIGNDPKKWRTNVSNYSKVKYQNVYPGVDLVYYGNQRQLEYDFVVAPGANPSAIALDVGAGLVPTQGRPQGSPLRIADNGDLVVETDGGEVRFHKPLVYQPAINSRQRIMDYGQRTPVEGHFVLQANNQVGFKVAPYDHTRPLIIDPVLVYSTYLGGSIADQGNSIAVDSFGYVYVTGWTESADFPTVNPLQATNHAYPNSNVFVSKINPTGSALVYSTFLGGTGFSEGGVNSGDIGYGIAVDPSGNAYVTGMTTSLDFPTFNAFQGQAASGEDAFVAKLNTTGSALVYSTYLGGSSYDRAWGIAADSSGNAYVIGETSSNDFPTVNALQATNHTYLLDYTVFVTKFNPAGSALVYSTYLGGSNEDEGYAIAVDSSGNAYVTGETFSTDFPTVNPFQATCGSCKGHDSNAFVAKLNAAGSALVYSTYLGGSGADAAQGIVVDSSGNAYVAGATSSTNFPTVNPFQATKHASEYSNAFVTKLNAAGSALVYSTYLGGSDSDGANGIAVDSFGNTYVVGSTNSTDFPTVNPVQGDFGGGIDAFVAEVNAAGSALVYSTYLGGNSLDFGQGIGVGSSGNAYVTGTTASGNFPTVNPLQATVHSVSAGNAFITKISATGAAPSVSCSPTSLTFGAQNVGTTSAAQTATVTNTGTANLTLSTVTVGGTNASDFATSADTCTGATVTPNGTCTVSVTFTPSATGDRSASLILTDNASGSPQSLSLTGTGGTAPPVAGVSPSSLTFSYEGVGTTSASQSITLSNTGSAALTITSIATSANFSQTNNCVGSVAGGGSCSLNVTFSPTATGPFNGTLTITDNSNGVANSTQGVALSGTGQDFTLGVAAGSSTSATVAPGQTATYTLSVVPGQGGFGQSVSFTHYVCQVPMGANCAFSPNPVTPGTSVTNVTLTVTTTAPSVAQPRSRLLPLAPTLAPGQRVLLMLALILAAMAWAFGRRNQPGASRWQPTLVPLAAGLLLTLALAGCGGGGGSTPPSNTGTPPGTYPFTVTGTAGSGASTLSHSMTLTLIVS
ncbi:MAG: SBBP repeat-containing protein [Terriglobia bacterium]